MSMCPGHGGMPGLGLAPRWSSLSWYSSRAGWWISEHNAFYVIWKLFGIETAVVKGFFSKINILEDKFLAQNHISQLAAGIGRSWRNMTPPKIEK